MLRRTLTTVTRPLASVASAAPQLSKSEVDLLRSQWENLAYKHPSVAREFLDKLNGGHTQYHGSSMGVGYEDTKLNGNNEGPEQFKVFNKVTVAKMRTAQGQGKTLFFAYLSQVDKRKILKLTCAPGAEEMSEFPHGKTAFFASLPGEVKYNALQKWKAGRDEKLSDAPCVPPTQEQLAKLCLLTALPMVGFGFVDNFLMICCGDAIEGHFGRLGLSTMAAAGLGNLCSDVAGLGLADYIEHAAGKLGLPQPNLTRQQRQLPLVRYTGTAGAVMGISVGCMLGMFPLLFLNRKDKECSVA